MAKKFNAFAAGVCFMGLWINLAKGDAVGTLISCALIAANLWLASE